MLLNFLGNFLGLCYGCLLHFKNIGQLISHRRQENVKDGEISKKKMRSPDRTFFNAPNQSCFK